MSDCSAIQTRFSEYLDGVIPGSEMRTIASHLSSCPNCSDEFAQWKAMQRLLGGVGPKRPPADLGLRLRVAISQERARTPQRRLQQVQLYWENSLAPVLTRAAAGMATAMLLLGTLGFMVRTVAVPPTVAATEAVAEGTSTPQFLYRVGGQDSGIRLTHPLMVEAEISKGGEVYSYRIVSGEASPRVQRQLDNFLLMSRFTPALFYGIPVPSRAILSFTGPRRRTRG
jgi:hypothetical protein